MTEEEAKTKWCPFARAPQSAGAVDTPSANRTAIGGVDIGSRCIASACMAWRQRGSERIHGALQPLPSGSGFCGLAGALQ